MRIAVLGAGAMGSLFGGHLAAAGEEVTLVDVWQEHVDKLNNDGLGITPRGGERRVIPVQATTDQSSVGPVDLIIVFVKCFHTEQAVRAALPLVGPDTAVLSLQNGLGNGDVIASVVGRERLLVGVTYSSATLLGPGEIAHTNKGRTVVGEPDGGVSPRVQNVVAALQRAGLEAEASPRVMDLVWTKLTLNAACLGVAALTRMTAGEQAAHAEVAQVIRILTAETVAVARAAGSSPSYANPPDDIIGFLAKAGPAKASMLQDVEAGRRTEIDVINGAVVAQGAKYGVPTPVNQLIVQLVKGLEAHIMANK